MTKPLSALLAVALAFAFSDTASAQPVPSDPDPVLALADDVQPLPDLLPLTRPGWPGQVNPFVIEAPAALQVADVPAWVFEAPYAHPEYRNLMLWSSSRPETWGVETARYQVAIPGPSYVGLIPSAIPEGWTVTNRCVAWDDTYVRPETPLGECYVFEMRPMLVSILQFP